MNIIKESFTVTFTVTHSRMRIITAQPQEAVGCVNRHVMAIIKTVQLKDCTAANINSFQPILAQGTIHSSTSITMIRAAFIINHQVTDYQHQHTH